MKLTIRDYGKIIIADIDLKPGINLVIGHNRSGKTTLLRAIAAASSPSIAAMPAGVLKKDSSQLVSTTAKTASIALDGMFIKFPANTITGKSVFLPPSRIAMGQDEWTTMTKPDRAAAMRLLAPGVDVTINDLLAHLRIESGPHYDTIKSMMGVASVHTLAAQKVTERTGAWKHVTGENFGTKILLEWRPEGWAQDGDVQVSAEQIQKRLDELTNELSAAQQNRAIHLKIQEMSGLGSAEPGALDPKYDEQLAALSREMALESANLEPVYIALDEQIVTAERLHQATLSAKSALALCQSDLKREKSRQPPAATACPGCQMPLSIVGATVVDAATLAGQGPRLEEINRIMALGKEARIALDAAEQSQKNHISLDDIKSQIMAINVKSAEKQKSIQAEINAITKQQNEAKSIINHANFRRQWLKDNAPTGNCPTEEEIVSLREHIAEHNDVLKKINQLADANKIKKDILFWLAVKDASGDQGLRKTAMEKGLASINEQINGVAEKMFFDSTLEINIDGDLFSDGRMVALMSGAERKQANIVMQSLVSTAEQAAIILIDEVGIIFDAISRQSLFEMLAERHADKIVVVAMAGKTVTTPSSILDLCANVFSVKNGVVSVYPTV